MCLSHSPFNLILQMAVLGCYKWTFVNVEVCMYKARGLKC